MKTASQDEVRALVTGILISEFDIEEASLRPDARVRDDLDLDSLDAVDLLARLEEETGLKVNDDALAEAETLDDVIRAVHAGLAPSLG
jgi:acyl carrier protein